MNRYTLVVKVGKHPSGWGLPGWMREKLDGYDWHRGLADIDQGAERIIYIDTTDDLTDKLNTWYCEPGDAPFPAGTLLHWSCTPSPCRHGTPPCGHCH